MSDLRVQVRTAILAADAVGYSRSMSVDEIRTVQALAESRRVIDPLIATHHGRIFNTAGDSVLAAFDEPQAAVACAFAIQQALGRRTGRPASSTGSACRSARPSSTAIICWARP